MADESKRTVEAIWIPQDHPAFSSKSRCVKMCKALFGMKDDPQPLHISLDLVDGGRLVRRSLEHGYHWPSDHENSGTKRHEWKEAENRGGVKLGYLIPEPVDEPEPDEA